jgi:ABC-type branched-subunit amino acid transport system substrate-binding protein
VIVAFAAVAFGWSSVATASSARPVPLVGRGSVLIGSDQPLSGPAAIGYGEIAPASKAFFEYVNAHGGVYGRRIDYTYLDDANDPTKALDDEKQLVNSDHVFAVFNAFGVITHQAVVGFLNRSRVPDLFVGSSCACWNQPSRHPETFGFGANYTLEGRLMGHYIARAFPRAKVAYIWEDDQCCQQAVRELDEEIPRSRVVTRQTFTISDLLKPGGLLAQVKTAHADGARVVVLDTLAPAATALVLLDAASIGYHPTIADTFRLSADPTTVAAWIARYSAGKGSPVLENGLITQDYLPAATDTADPWIRAFRRIHEAYEPNTPFDNMTVYGMAAAYTITQALRQAGRNPTRQSIIATIDHGAANASGPALVGLRDSVRDHDGYPGEQIGKITNDKLVLSGPVYEAGLSGPLTAHQAARSPLPTWLPR